jgi:hypothetical protein
MRCRVEDAPPVDHAAAAPTTGNCTRLSGVVFISTSPWNAWLKASTAGCCAACALHEPTVTVTAHAVCRYGVVFIAGAVSRVNRRTSLE